MNVSQPAARVFTVGEFSAKMVKLFGRVRSLKYLGITGEISEWTPRSTGVYFTIKDATAVLQCFASNYKARVLPVVGVGSAVVAYGQIRAAIWRSRYELVVDRVELTGIGELHRQYEALKDNFRRRGYFDAARKRPIPSFPGRIVLISARGKGAEDFLNTMRLRAPQAQVSFIETRVQGLGAEVDVSEAFDRAAMEHPDVIVLARGGGSYEDLFTFNQEAVVRAILRSKAPVITGIGHTGDHHLADDVADAECETPSNAAQFIASLWQKGGEKLARLTMKLDREMSDALTRAVSQVDARRERLLIASERGFTRRSQLLSRVEKRLLAKNPVLHFNQQMNRLTELRARLTAWPDRALAWWNGALDVRRERLARVRHRYFAELGNGLTLATSRLVSTDPMKPMERGYAIVTYAGRALRNASTVKPGDEVMAKLFRGSLKAHVEAVMPDG